MKHYLVIDLEATCCDDNSFPRNEMETIEIGAVMVCSRTFLPIEEFQSFVSPIRHPILTDFCRELTGITQLQVENAPPFEPVIKKLSDWAHTFPDFTFCSWGNYDHSQLRSDCEYHEFEFPLGEKHINLKEQFALTRGHRKKSGVQAALRSVGLQFIGSHHRGIDDARNIARLLPYIFTPQSRN
ncbi:3'-5' exonuclease [uncultured Rubinisphaera sp.]|uniref:3'-5' exonuclease n=1 Tax=uncultured Rubinisphaera sp. TaxID=1678686 RepID=UPI0030DAEE49|tara:strand:+ start:1186 stop:1737 length:552 start_codon:yes stop_codon:yes gene_type:complete